LDRKRKGKRLETLEEGTGSWAPAKFTPAKAINGMSFHRVLFAGLVGIKKIKVNKGVST